MKTRDALGDRCKAFEMAEAGRKAMQGLPLLARLDGRAFHTFTRGLERPYDPRFNRLMVETTRFLVGELHALIGYTQSDEISLMWHETDPKTEMLFGGRFQKITSVVAGLASARFAQMIPDLLPDKAGRVPCFDCRAWQVPTREDALEVFLWREDDATKNSVSMLTRGHYSAKEMHGQGRADQMDMLMAKGVNWNDQPAFFKRGTYVRRRTVQRALTPDERERIPEAHRPAAGELVTRSVVDDVDMPPIRRVGNLIAVLFDGADPVLREPTP